MYIRTLARIGWRMMNVRKRMRWILCLAGLLLGLLCWNRAALRSHAESETAILRVEEAKEGRLDIFLALPDGAGGAVAILLDVEGKIDRVEAGEGMTVTPGKGRVLVDGILPEDGWIMSIHATEGVRLELPEGEEWVYLRADDGIIKRLPLTVQKEAESACGTEIFESQSERDEPPGATPSACLGHYVTAPEAGRYTAVFLFETGAPTPVICLVGGGVLGLTVSDGRVEFSGLQVGRRYELWVYEDARPSRPSVIELVVADGHDVGAGAADPG